MIGRMRSNESAVGVLSTTSRAHALLGIPLKLVQHNLCLDNHRHADADNGPGASGRRVADSLGREQGPRQAGLQRLPPGWCVAAFDSVSNCSLFGSVSGRGLDISWRKKNCAQSFLPAAATGACDLVSPSSLSHPLLPSYSADIYGNVIRQKAFPVLNVVDTTGAGDCFTAAFAVAMLEGKSDAEAMAFASAWQMFWLEQWKFTILHLMPACCPLPQAWQLI